MKETKYCSSEEIPDQKLHRFVTEPRTFPVGKFSKITSSSSQILVDQQIETETKQKKSKQKQNS